MFEKRKRGNGSALQDYYLYKSHVSKLQAIENDVSDVQRYYEGDTGLQKQEEQRHRSNLLREKRRRMQRRDLAFDNIQIYQRMLSIIHNERVPRLEQKGPMSLNYAAKKQEFKRIVEGNRHLKTKLFNQDSGPYAQDSNAMRAHQNKYNLQKRLLAGSSPSRSKLDPLLLQALSHDLSKKSLGIEDPERSMNAISSLSANRRSELPPI